MKVKTILTLALAATTLAACHRGKKPPRMDNSKLAISLSKPAKGDRAIYGLACLGCSDTALVLLPNGGGDPRKIQHSGCHSQPSGVWRYRGGRLGLRDAMRGEG